MFRLVFLSAALLVAAACGDAENAASSTDTPAALGSFEQTYGVLGGDAAGMPVRVTTSTGTAGFVTFAYDAAAGRATLFFIVCVERPCPDEGTQGAVTFTSPPLAIEGRYADQADWRTAPGAPTEVAVRGAQIRRGVPLQITVDVLDAPKAHLEGALYPFRRTE